MLNMAWAQSVAINTMDKMTAWHLFLQANLLVQIIMVGLLIASIMSWAIILNKRASFAFAKLSIIQFENFFWSGQPLEELYAGLKNVDLSPAESVFAAAMQEWKKSYKDGCKNHTGLIERIERVVSVSINREINALNRRVNYLASLGSSAPFIGLFGTVWGIMHSFTGIALSKSTNISVVAPGIAEALMATAMGLAAAIPAVIGYNFLLGKLNDIENRLTAFGEDFITILSRQADQLNK